MKQLLVSAFLVASVVACSKNKPATAKAPTPDAKMEGGKVTGPQAPNDDKKPNSDAPTGDPCAN